MYYRAYVGNESKYDINSAIQFNLLTVLGLREYHKVLDIGCGSLRVGRLLIPYLDKRGYCGIEPEKWLVDDGINNEVGESLIRMREPRFIHSRDFPVASFNERFDFVLAYSIFTHASQEQIKKCLKNVEKNLVEGDETKRGGIIIASFMLGNEDYMGDKWVYPSHTGRTENGFVKYTEDTIKRMAAESNLFCSRIDWVKIHKQVWMVLGRKDDIKTLCVSPLYKDIFRLRIIDE